MSRQRTNDPGFDHLKDNECKKMSVLLRRMIFLQNKIHSAESHGIRLDRDRAEVGALSWAIDWIRKTRKADYV